MRRIQWLGVFVLFIAGMASGANAAQVESGFGGVHLGMVVESKDSLKINSALLGVDYMFFQSRGEMSIVSFLGLGLGITTAGNLAPELIPIQVGSDILRGGLAIIPPVGGQSQWTGGVIVGLPFGSW